MLNRYNSTTTMERNNGGIEMSEEEFKRMRQNKNNQEIEKPDKSTKHSLSKRGSILLLKAFVRLKGKNSSSGSTPNQASDPPANNGSRSRRQAANSQNQSHSDSQANGGEKSRRRDSKKRKKPVRRLHYKNEVEAPSTTTLTVALERPSEPQYTVNRRLGDEDEEKSLPPMPSSIPYEGKLSINKTVPRGSLDSEYQENVPKPTKEDHANGKRSSLLVDSIASLKNLSLKEAQIDSSKELPEHDLNENSPGVWSPPPANDDVGIRPEAKMEDAGVDEIPNATDDHDTSDVHPYSGPIRNPSSESSPVKLEPKNRVGDAPPQSHTPPSPRKQSLLRHKNVNNNTDSIIHDLKVNLRTMDPNSMDDVLHDPHSQFSPVLNLDDKVSLFQFHSSKVLVYDDQPHGPEAQDDSKIISGRLLGHGLIEIFQLHNGDVTYLSCGTSFVYPLLPKLKILRTTFNTFVLPLINPERYWKISIGTDDDYEVLLKLERILKENVNYRNLYQGERERLKELSELKQGPKKEKGEENKESKDYTKVQREVVPVEQVEREALGHEKETVEKEVQEKKEAVEKEKKDVEQIKKELARKFGEVNAINADEKIQKELAEIADGLKGDEKVEKESKTGSTPNRSNLTPRIVHPRRIDSFSEHYKNGLTSADERSMKPSIVHKVIDGDFLSHEIPDSPPSAPLSPARPEDTELSNFNLDSTPSKQPRKDGSWQIERQTSGNSFSTEVACLDMDHQELVQVLVLRPLPPGASSYNSRRIELPVLAQGYNSTTILGPKPLKSANSFHASTHILSQEDAGNESDSSMDSLIDEYEENLSSIPHLKTGVTSRIPSRAPSRVSTSYDPNENGGIQYRRPALFQGKIDRDDVQHDDADEEFPSTSLSEYNRIHNGRSRRSSRSEVVDWATNNNKSGTLNGTNGHLTKSRSTYSIASSYRQQGAGERGNLSNTYKEIYRSITQRNLAQSLHLDDDTKSTKSALPHNPRSRHPPLSKSAFTPVLIGSKKTSDSTRRYANSVVSERPASIIGGGGLSSSEIYKMLSTSKSHNNLKRELKNAPRKDPAPEGGSLASKLFGW